MSSQGRRNDLGCATTFGLRWTTVAEVVYIAQTSEAETLPPIPAFRIRPQIRNPLLLPKPYSCAVLSGARLPEVPIREIQSMKMPSGFIQTTMPIAGAPGQIYHVFHTKDEKESLVFYCWGLTPGRKPLPLLQHLFKQPPHTLTKTEIRSLIMEAEEHYLPYDEEDALVRTVKWNGRTVIEQQRCLWNGTCSYGIIYDRRYRKTDEPLRMEITFYAPREIFEQRLPEIRACLQSLKWSKQIAPQ